MRKGRLVVFEGLDKSGKTAILKELAGRDDRFFYNSSLRKNSLIGRFAIAHPSSIIFSAIMLADSFRIRRYLSEGRTVLQDRYYPSVATYSPRFFNRAFGIFASYAFPRPDVYVHVTVSKEKRLERLSHDLKNRYHGRLFWNPELIGARENSYLDFYTSYSGKKAILDTTSSTLEEAVNEAEALIS